MNTISNGQILQYLQKQFDMYDDKDILGIFAIGKVNRGEAKTTTDIHYCLVTIPTLEAMAFNTVSDYPKVMTEEKNVTVELLVLGNIIKAGQEHLLLDVFTTKYFILNPLYEKEWSKIKENPDNDLLNRYQSAACNILMKYFLSGEKNISADLKITGTEEKALKYLIDTIGEEGNISISAAIAESGISRPVFSSVLNKINNNGARVKNMGVKGTYIKFYSNILQKYK